MTFTSRDPRIPRIPVFRLLRSRTNLALENAALRQQLTIYQRDQKHPRLRAGDRMFWILLRRLWSGWEQALIHRNPDPYPELTGPPPATGRLVALPVLGGLIHDYRLAA